MESGIQAWASKVILEVIHSTRKGRDNLRCHDDNLPLINCYSVIFTIKGWIAPGQNVMIIAKLLNNVHTACTFSINFSKIMMESGWIGWIYDCMHI